MQFFLVSVPVSDDARSAERIIFPPETATDISVDWILRSSVSVSDMLRGGSL
jgi:hypothetical protein